MEIEAMKNLSIYHLVRFPAGYNTEAPNTIYPTILALYGHGNAKRSVCQKKTGRNYLFWKAAIWNGIPAANKDIPLEVYFPGWEDHPNSQKLNHETF